MALNLDAIGTKSAPIEHRWTSDDTLLYSVAVGAGYPDPLGDLAFTTENSADIDQAVLPTFAVIAGMGVGAALGSIGSFNPAMLVHAEQRIELHRPLTPAGGLSIAGALVDIVDKRSGALVIAEGTATDIDSGDAVFTARMSVFIRGEGGFATEGADIGRSGTSAAANAVPVQIPGRAPDHQLSYDTLANQALLYRLCGDRNPLHSDPTFAAFGGFDRPILHGLCTYGFTGRALLAALCDSDVERFVAMEGRFSKPVFPGETLTISIWDHGDGDAVFQTSVGDAVVIDRGRCEYRPS